MQMWDTSWAIHSLWLDFLSANPQNFSSHRFPQGKRLRKFSALFMKNFFKGQRVNQLKRKIDTVREKRRYS